MKTIHSPLSNPKYRPDIDGLRAIAVLGVVVFHAFPIWLRGGFIGVDIFFVISGYLISTIIFENLEHGTFSFTQFYARRIKRIFPALALVLATTLVIGWFLLLADEYQQLGKHVAAGAGFISNFILWQEVGYFNNAAETKPLLHLWSLGIEEQFYIIWPLLLWFAWKRNFNLLTITVICLITSFILNLKGIKHDAVATFYSPQTRFWELLCGSLLAWVMLYKKERLNVLLLKADHFLKSIIFRDGDDLGESQENKLKTLANFSSFLGLLLLLYGFWRINKELNFPGTWPLIPIVGTLLLIIGGSNAWVNRHLLSNKVVVWFGLISFPLYLWHWPLLSFLSIVVDHEISTRNFRIAAVILSIGLAWLTYRLIERPIRFGKRGKVKVAILCSLVSLLGATGLFLSQSDLSNSHSYDKLLIKRKGFEHAYGFSLAWFRGKEDWLFLGNAHDNTVAKLKLAVMPPDKDVEVTTETFSKIASTAAKYNTRVVMIMGPDKPSIYPEYLPDNLIPSSNKYSSFFLDKLKTISNLNVYDPTDDLLNLKKSEGFLYWMTDTHWNHKGAFLAYYGFCNLNNIPVPKVQFQQGEAVPHELIEMSKLKNFPLHREDQWDVVWKQKLEWAEKEIPNQPLTSFGISTVVTNPSPLSNKYIWVTGDSFTNGLRQYLNATFKEVRYIGHWANKLKELPEDLEKSERKPDMIIVVKVERSF